MPARISDACYDHLALVIPVEGASAHVIPEIVSGENARPQHSTHGNRRTAQHLNEPPQLPFKSGAFCPETGEPSLFPQRLGAMLILATALLPNDEFNAAEAMYRSQLLQTKRNRKNCPTFLRQSSA
jgi:hypothetical protein